MPGEHTVPPRCLRAAFGPPSAGLRSRCCPFCRTSAGWQPCSVVMMYLRDPGSQMFLHPVRPAAPGHVRLSVRGSAVLDWSNMQLPGQCTQTL